jgi:hypothetical protein
MQLNAWGSRFKAARGDSSFELMCVFPINNASAINLSFFAPSMLAKTASFSYHGNRRDREIENNETRS